MSQHKLDSLEPLINRKVLFVKEIDPSLSKAEIRTELLMVCSEVQGRIVVPVDNATQNTLRCAYLNFYDKDEAAAALRRYRYTLRVRGRLVRLNYAVDQDARDRVFGPWGQKFAVVVRNLPPNVDGEALRQLFEESVGEVFQSTVLKDTYGNTYGIVQFVEERNVEVACQKMDHTAMENCIISVDPHRPRWQAQTAQAAPSLASRDQFPSLGGGGGGGGGGAAGAAGTSSSGADGAAADAAAAATQQYAAPAAAYSQQQQQQQQQQQRQQTAAAAAPMPMPVPVPVPVAVSMAPTAADLKRTNPQSLQLFELYQQRSTAAAAAAPRMAAPVPTAVGISQLQATAAPWVPSGENGHSAASLNGLLQRASLSAQPAASAVGQSAATTAIISAMGLTSRPAAAAAAAAAAAPAAAGGRVGLRDSLKQALQQLDHLAEMMCCPITQEVFKDPVVAADGHTYERSAIVGWLATHATSPMTNDVLPHRNLLPNNLVKALAADLA